MNIAGISKSRTGSSSSNIGGFWDADDTSKTVITTASSSSAATVKQTNVSTTTNKMASSKAPNNYRTLGEAAFMVDPRVLEGLTEEEIVEQVRDALRRRRHEEQHGPDPENEEEKKEEETAPAPVVPVDSINPSPFGELADPSTSSTKGPPPRCCFLPLPPFFLRLSKGNALVPPRSINVIPSDGTHSSLTMPHNDNPGGQEIGGGDESPQNGTTTSPIRNLQDAGVHTLRRNRGMLDFGPPGPADLPQRRNGGASVRSWFYLGVNSQTDSVPSRFSGTRGDQKNPQQDF